MTRAEFENLVRAGQIRAEAFDQGEFDGLLRSGRARLRDARSLRLSLESRFDLAYNGVHALALAKCHGLRNAAEYEGALDIDDRLVLALIAAADAVDAALTRKDAD